MELMTDYLNDASRRAILRLGAKEEGVLRNHVVMPNGRIRDTVVFSILKNECPGVKQNLEYKLGSRRCSGSVNHSGAGEVSPSRHAATWRRA